jgi:hypothetical protein
VVRGLWFYAAAWRRTRITVPRWQRPPTAGFAALASLSGDAQPSARLWDAVEVLTEATSVPHGPETQVLIDSFLPAAL